MEGRSRARAATIVVINRTTTPSPKHKNLQQKVSHWIGGAQSPQNFKFQFLWWRATTSYHVSRGNRYKQLGVGYGCYEGHLRKTC